MFAVTKMKIPKLPTLQVVSGLFRRVPPVHAFSSAAGAAHPPVGTAVRAAREALARAQAVCFDVDSTVISNFKSPFTDRNVFKLLISSSTLLCQLRRVSMSSLSTAAPEPK